MLYYCNFSKFWTSSKLVANISSTAYCSRTLLGKYCEKKVRNYTVLQLDHSNVVYVMDSVLINNQLTINNCLSKGFPDQISESL